MYLSLFILAALVSFLAGYPVRTLALRLNIVDHPEKRKMHQIPIPLMGGLAIALSFVVITSAALALAPGLQGVALKPYLGLLAGAVPILLLGIYDDVKGVKAPIKFAVQVVAALIVIAMGARIEAFTNPLGASFNLGWLGIPVAILWIVGVTNAVNLIDGLDGLAVGIGTIAALGLFAVAAPASPLLAAVTITLAGAGFGFLRHNFYPARIFLGDTGSMFIGYTLAVVGLQGSLKATAATVLFLPIIVLGVPIFDTLFAIFRRARRQVSPFKPDREHIHHRLVRVGLHHRKVVLVLYFVCAYLALTAYSISQLPYQTAFLFLVVLTMGGIIGLGTLRFIEERLEVGLAARPHLPPSSGLTNRRSPRRRNPRAAAGSEHESLICVIRGFREGFGDPLDLRAMCLDLSTMLSRRFQVFGVRAEPIGPATIILLIHCEPLKGSLISLVKDGIAWYLEDHRDRFSSDPGFPAIEWLDTRPSPRTVEGPPPVVATEERASPALPLREGRAGALGP